MNTDPRQYVLLLIALLVPVYLLYTRREKLLLGWIGITMFVHIFDTTIITNLPAGRIVGLLYLPQALRHARSWLQWKPVRAWVVNYAYLLILGLCFGVLWQWPDITGIRPFSLTAPGRTLVYSTRLLSDFSLALLVAQLLFKAENLLMLGKALVWGATLSALAGILYFLFRTDLYFPLTGLGEQGLQIDRARGLSIEPRALGLGCAYGTMILLLGRQLIARTWYLLLAINVIGLLVTYSASSLALLIVGVIVSSVFFTNRERAIVIGVLLLTLLLIGWSYLYAPQQFQYALDTLQFRLDPNYKLNGIAPGNFGQEIAYRLDVFDASALLFLLDQPFYALLGTGPGLVCLPASFYVPPGLYSNIWTAGTGINSLPFHGLLLEICNSGVLGIFFWWMQVTACLAALRFLAQRMLNRTERTMWRLGYAIFMIGTVFYFVQVSSSPVWSLCLGIGWAATALAANESVKVTQAAVEEYHRKYYPPDWELADQQRAV